MDGNLATNFTEILPYLDLGFDTLGIISGFNRTGVGKTTIGFQICYYIAWLIAGGKMNLQRKEDSNKFVNPVVIKKPDKPVRFGLENVVFSSSNLMKTAETLYKKYGKHQLIFYDEGREATDSKSSMTRLYRELDEFFNVCRIYGHIFIIVVNNAFKLHEDYFVSRADWLLDCYLVDNVKRGNFRLWSREKKEKLYVFGKRLLGATAKYLVEDPDFYGTFTKLFLLDEKSYEKKKLKAIRKRKITQRDKKMKIQRNAWVFLYKKFTKKTSEQLAEEISEELQQKFSKLTVDRILHEHKAHLLKKGEEIEQEDIENE